MNYPAARPRGSSFKASPWQDHGELRVQCPSRGVCYEGGGDLDR
jgi:hypothetical protein